MTERTLQGTGDQETRTYSALGLLQNQVNLAIMQLGVSRCPGISRGLPSARHGAGTPLTRSQRQSMEQPQEPHTARPSPPTSLILDGKDGLSPPRFSVPTRTSNRGHRHCQRGSGQLTEGTTSAHLGFSTTHPAPQKWLSRRHWVPVVGTPAGTWCRRSRHASHCEGP